MMISTGVKCKILKVLLLLLKLRNKEGTMRKGQYVSNLLSQCGSNNLFGMASISGILEISQ
jgi:hypothetical protein